MTTLADTKLGDRVRIWLDQGLQISDTKTGVMSIEATVIGRWEDEEQFALGWTEHQIYPSSADQMSVPIPKWDTHYVWVENRTAFHYFSDTHHEDMECEILPPLQEAKPNQPKQTVKETKWVNATFKDVKLGDKVRVYLFKNGNLAYKRGKGRETIEATVIGLEPTSSDSYEDASSYDVLLGWKKGEQASKDAFKNMKQVCFKQQIPDDHKTYPLIDNIDFEHDCQVLQTIEVPVETAAAKETLLEAYGQCMLGQEAEAKPEAKDTGSAWIAAAIGGAAMAAGVVNAMCKVGNVRVADVNDVVPVVEAAEQMKAVV
jgi:hypothetical protein